MADLPAPAPRVERATVSDLDALVSLEQQCFDPRVAVSRRQFRYLLSRPTAEIWVWRNGGRVAADAVILRRHTPRGLLGRVYSLAVAPDQRGRGLGRRLLRVCLDRLRRQGAYAIVLEVRSNNRPALALYHAEGFQVERRLNGYYGAGQSAIRMRRNQAGVEFSRFPALALVGRRQVDLRTPAKAAGLPNNSRASARFSFSR